MLFPTEKNIEDYLLIKRMLNAQKLEFDLLSKKKLDGQLNKMKIKMVNRILEPLHEIFKNETSIAFLDLLNEEDIPTNSDVVLIISQYQTAIKEFKEKYYKVDKYQSTTYSTKERWMTQEYPPDYYKTHKK